ncbi:unnamed protein product, partial [Phaeothamnion confervicola]
MAAATSPLPSTSAKGRAPLWKPRQARFALRVTLCVLLASIFAYVPSAVDVLHGKLDTTWIVITVFVVQEKTAVESMLKGAQRVVGTIVGGALGFALGIGLTGAEPNSWKMWVHLVLTAVCIFSLFYFVKDSPLAKDYDYAVTICGMSFGIVFFTLYDGGSRHVAAARACSIVLGVAIAAAVGGLVLPSSAEDELNDLMAFSCEELAEVSRLVGSYAAAAAADNGRTKPNPAARAAPAVAAAVAAATEADAAAVAPKSGGPLNGERAGPALATASPAPEVPFSTKFMPVDGDTINLPRKFATLAAAPTAAENIAAAAAAAPAAMNGVVGEEEAVAPTIDGRYPGYENSTAGYELAAAVCHHLARNDNRERYIPSALAGAAITTLPA